MNVSFDDRDGNDIDIARRKGTESIDDSTIIIDIEETNEEVIESKDVDRNDDQLFFHNRSKNAEGRKDEMSYEEEEEDENDVEREIKAMIRRFITYFSGVSCGILWMTFSSFWIDVLFSMSLLWIIFHFYRDKIVRYARIANEYIPLYFKRKVF